MKKELALTLLISSIVLGSAACTAEGSPEKDKDQQGSQNPPVTAQKEDPKADNPATSENQDKVSTLADNPNFDVKEFASEKKDDPQLKTAIKDQLNLSDSDYEQTRYYYNFVDLNDDGLNEVLVYLVGPSVSGTGGDPLMIFEKTDKDYIFKEQILLTNNPILISNDKNQGYRDLVIRQSGGGASADWKILQYNGKEYSTMNDATPLPADQMVKGMAIITDDIAKDFQEGHGLLLK